MIFDTTLRDGEQSPGCSMAQPEKVRVARALAELGVDVIEAGFPAASRGDWESVNAVAREVQGPIICGPARCSLMTGRWPKATRVRENAALGHITALTDLSTTMREQGYRVLLSGKNHTYLSENDFDWSSMYMHDGGGRPDRRTERDAAVAER